MKRNIVLKIYTLLLSVTIGLSSCKDFLEVYPHDGLVQETAINNMTKANAALNGVYYQLMTAQLYGTDLISWGEVRGDDMGTTRQGDRTTELYEFAHTTPLNYRTSFWSYMYNGLVRVNMLLEAIEKNEIVIETEDDEKILNDIKGQALALRALFHFDIVKTHGEPYLKNKNAYGAVIADRVILDTEKPQRSTVEDTYNFIVNDLKAALGLVGTEKTPFTFNVWSVKAFLCKVYLYQGNWEEAYNLGKDVVTNGGYTLISNANYTASWSLESTSESVFEIHSSEAYNADREGIGYVMLPRIGDNGGYGAISATEDFIALMNEDPSDVRLGIMKTNDQGVDQAYIVKYPGRGGNSYVNNARVIRLSDIYLMVAEAGLHAGKSDASTYLNEIRKRANPAVSDVTATLELVEKERRKELVGEGHRYFDIIRNLQNKSVARKGLASNPVVSDEVPVISWNNADTHRLILPISQTEIETNPDIYQNAGYTN